MKNLRSIIASGGIGRSPRPEEQRRTRHGRARIGLALSLAGLAGLSLAGARPVVAEEGQRPFQAPGSVLTAPFAIQAVVEGLPAGPYSIEVPIGVATFEGSDIGRTPLLFPAVVGTPLHLEVPPSRTLGRLSLRFAGWVRDGEVLGTDTELEGTVDEATTLTAVYEVEPDTPSVAPETGNSRGKMHIADTPSKPGTPIPQTPIKPGPPRPPFRYGPPIPGTPVKPGPPRPPVKPGIPIPGAPVKPGTPFIPEKQSK